MNASTYIPSSRTIGDEIADDFDQNKRSLTDAEKRRLAGMIDAQVDHIIAERDRLASACEGIRDAQAAGELSYRSSDGRGYDAMLEIERVLGPGASAGDRSGWDEVEAIRQAIEPVLDWYQSDEEQPRLTVDIIKDIVADLQSDRDNILKLRNAAVFAVKEVRAWMGNWNADAIDRMRADFVRMAERLEQALKDGAK
jgi:hypothetical protein